MPFGQKFHRKAIVRVSPLDSAVKINFLLTDPIRNTKLIQKMVSHGVGKGVGGMTKELAVKGILDLLNEFMKYAFDKQIGPARLYRRH